jgi:hypothetical protein
MNLRLSIYDSCFVHLSPMMAASSGPVDGSNLVWKNAILSQRKENHHGGNFPPQLMPRFRAVSLTIAARSTIAATRITQNFMKRWALAILLLVKGKTK